MHASIYPVRPVLTLAAVLAMVAPACGDVVISMPPPKKAAAPAVSTSAATSTPTVANAVDQPGKLALARYSRARTGTRDTYFMSSRRAGYRIYSTPILYDYPFFWGWPFVHVHSHSCK